MVAVSMESDVEIGFCTLSALPGLGEIKTMRSKGADMVVTIVNIQIYSFELRWRANRYVGSQSSVRKRKLDR